MNPFNIYSLLIFALFGFSLVALLVLWRRISKARILALFLLASAMLAAWWSVRPVQTQHTGLADLQAQIGAGQPVLLEFQSPY